jgi:deoxyribonuclease-4
MLRIGAHVDQTDPLAEATARQADLVQFFLGDPQGWKGPVVAYQGGAEALRAGAAERSLPLYVHAPYVLNVATTNNRIRIPSRKLLGQHAAAAAAIGAKGLIVHGGHLNAKDDPEVGFDNWRNTFSRATDDGGFGLPVLIENTAGGNNAMVRRFDRLARLWDAIGEYGPGFVLDTCHAHAAGEELDGIVERVRAITGRVDLVHANNSRDAFDSGADRHANLASGQIDPEVIAAVARAAGSDVIVETPHEGQADDIEFLRKAIAG